MPDYRELLDELFVKKLGYEFQGEELPNPEIDGKENIVSLSREYSANGVDVIVANCEDRIPEFQKKLIKHYKLRFPDSHFLFISNNGKVFDLYNVSSSQRLKKITYNEIDKNTRLFKEKIELFNVEHAEGTVDLKIKIDKAFDISDKITRQFFDKFEKIHRKLQSSIKGIKDSGDKSWYASVLMNRIMFIYFLQKHYVIQDDANFLLNKYNEVQSNREDYYKDFLLPLFFYGFAKRDTNPDKIKFMEKFGYVKYLNGGLFYPHYIERKYTPSPASKSQPKAYDDPSWIIENIKINLDGKVISDILKFLNGYTWYLDNRPMKEESDINPDVLGFIFEKYINQKEMGAYYTKEDITEHISKFTIIPFILDKLRANGYDAPDPTPLITNNKDIIGFMENYLDQLNDYETLRFLYKDILSVISILDPAVGSGAFLFAALNILLPIYRKVVFKLKSFREVKKDDKWLQELYDTLEKHSEEYYLTKQIILNNLYGVDIIEEAVEICKLRLFLQLASHLPNIKEIEPLPDIDFNIYAGNSLVGGLNWDDLEANYTMDLFTSSNRENIKNNIYKLSELKAEYKYRINAQISQLSNLKEKYKELQHVNYDEEELASLKAQIEYLEYEINKSINIGVKNPFHWFVEFNKIMDRNGFDVIIGNPPYIEYSKVRQNYEIKGYSTLKSGNSYSYFIERSRRVSNNKTYIGFIVQLSMVCTDRMKSTQKYLVNNSDYLFISTFDDRPGKLFDGLEHIRAAIFISKVGNNSKIYTTKYNRWYSHERDNLFQNIKYVKLDEHPYEGTFLKIGSKVEKNILAKLLQHKPLSQIVIDNKGEPLYYHNSPQYWIRATDFTPYFWNERDGEKLSQQVRKLYVKEEYYWQTLGLINSSLFYWWFIITSDCRHLNKREIDNFPSTINLYKYHSEFRKYAKSLMDNYEEYKTRKETHYKTTGKVIYDEYYPRNGKYIIDKIDDLLGELYELDKNEVEFIKNYDIKFRLGET